MLATPTAVPLGVNRDDGSEVLLSSDDGPLLIFGTSPGAGASFALKKLFAGLAEGWRSPNSDSVPPLLFSTTASRYKRVADAYGADFISAGPAVWPDDEPSGEQAGGPPSGPRIYQADLRRHDSSKLLHRLLLDHIHGSAQMYHILADDLDDLMNHEIAFALLWWAFRHGPGHNIFGAATTNASQLGSPTGKNILSITRRFIMLRTPSPERLPVPVTRALKGSGVEPSSLRDLPQGHGVLVHKPKRGAAREPATPVRINPTAEQRRIFNTDPAQEAKLRP